MTTYATRLVHAAVIILLTIGIMIAYAMPDKDILPELNDTCLATPTPVPAPTQIPTPAPPQPTHTPEKIDISVLSIYDRDGDGELNNHEANVVEYDYLYKRLTPAQIACAEKLGCIPEEAPSPTPTPATDPASTPTMNTTVSPADATPDRWADAERWRAEVADVMPKIDIGGMVDKAMQEMLKFF